MINTLLSQGAIESSQAMALSALIGFFFGLCLEKAGFGNSRKLAGIFYFRDMTVLKVMFSAVITAAIGFSILLGFKLVSLDGVFLMRTFMLVQAVGGFILGVGFVMGGWCPGTAAVGAASGKLDAMIFLVGALIGSVVYNEIYPYVSGLKAIGNYGLCFVYDDLGMSRPLFVLLLTVVGVAAFWGSEYLEKKRCRRGQLFNSPFLKAYSVVLIAAAASLFIFDFSPAGQVESATAARLEKAALALDHMDADELAARLLAGDNSITLIDVRSPAEYKRFHIRDAENIPLQELVSAKKELSNDGVIVLYSDGAAHAVQAQMLLEKEITGANILVLNGGLNVFIEKCLKPASLRMEPLDDDKIEKINRWREYFLPSD